MKIGQFAIRIGNNIKKYRKEKGLTLKELADRIGLTEATVQKYEAGNIQTLDIVKMKNFADALDVKLEQLVPWEENSGNSRIEPKQGRQEARIIKLYSQLTDGHKKAVQSLMENLIECQERYNSDK